MTHQPAISFSVSILFPFTGAGGRTSNVRSKMKKILFVTLGLIGTLNFCSCTHVIGERKYFDRDSEGGRAIAQLDQTAKDFSLRQREKEYFSVAKDFVETALASDLNDMLKLTSPITIKNSGSGTTRRVYEDQVIPQFKGTTVVWSQNTEIITDDRGIRGFVMSGRASGPRTFPFYVSVMRESGALRVITITRRRK